MGKTDSEGRKLVSVAEFAANYNDKLTRRGKRMSFSYIYRLIRQDVRGELTRPLWFTYVLEGPKERVWVRV